MSRSRTIVWIAAISAIIAGFLVVAGFVAWAVYGTLIEGTTRGPDFISAIQSNRLAADTISSIEIVEPELGYLPSAKELDSLPRRAKINSPTTINRLFALLKGAQSGMWPRNMNHPASLYNAWLKVNTRDGFFWLYCNLEEDYDGSFLTIGSNTRNATNLNGATSYYLDDFSEFLVILSNGPLWVIGPARTPLQSDSTYFHPRDFKYDFYDSTSNYFATVTLSFPSPIMEKEFYGRWYGYLAKSYMRPNTHYTLASDKLNATSAQFKCHLDPEHPLVATINLNPDEADDYITLSMPVSNQPVTGYWVYATDGGMVDSGTFTGPVSMSPR